MSLHVYPLNDEREHDIETSMCWCNPTMEIVNGEMLFIHNSADGRELIEQAEEIKNN